MYNELDELLKLTKLVEATSTNSDTEVAEEDLPGKVRVYDDYSGKPTFLHTQQGPAKAEDGEVVEVPQKPADGKAYGSSGNATYTDEHGEPKENGPLFEEDGPTTQPEEADLGKLDESNKEVSDAVNDLEQPMQDLASAEGEEPNSAPADTECNFGIRRSFNRALNVSPFGEAAERGMGREFCKKYLAECEAGNLCARHNPFKLGDVVQASGIPVMFVVKDNDGSMIRTAKPTDCGADLARGKDGVWPEYCFDCNELSKVGNADLSQAEYLSKFNDRGIARGFDGRTIDPGPMEVAQDFARNQTFGGIADNLDQILGTYREAASGNDPDYCYTEISPTTTYVLPSGEVTTKKIEGGCRYTR